MDGFGKVSRRKSYQGGRDPYSRPSTSTPKPNTEIVEVDGGQGTRGSLFGSVVSAATTPLRAAAGMMMNRVPLLAGYFGTPATADDTQPQQQPIADDSPEEDREPNQASRRRKTKSPSNPPLHKAVADLVKKNQPADEDDDSEFAIMLDSQFPSEQEDEGAPAANGLPANARKPRAQSAAALAEQRNQPAAGAVPSPNDHITPVTAIQQKSTPGSKDQTTPYDSVLALLRSGPLAMTPPDDLPKPRSRQPKTQEQPKRTRDATAAGGGAIGSGPSSAPPGNTGLLFSNRGAAAGGGTPISTGPPANLKQFNNPMFGGGGGGTPGGGGGLLSSRQPQEFGANARRYAGSRLGPLAGTTIVAGSTAAPVATTTAGPSGLRNSGGGGTFGGFLPAGPTSATPGLSWTPMRAGDKQPHSGAKRKAEMETPVQDGGEGGISILDAQRRIRQRSGGLPTTGGFGVGLQGSATAERRSWRAGRTPYRSGTGAFKLGGGGLGGGALGVSPVPLTGLSSGGAAGTPGSAGAHGTPTVGNGSGIKPTTDTARKILQTLQALDETLAKKSTPDQQAPSPPPTGSLGGQMAKAKKPAEAKKSGQQQQQSAGEKPRVTFGGVSFASPEPSKPQSKTDAADANEFSFGAGPKEPVAGATPAFKLSAPMAADPGTDNIKKAPTFGGFGAAKEQQQEAAFNFASKPAAAADKPKKEAPKALSIPPQQQQDLKSPSGGSGKNYSFGTSPRDPSTNKKIAEVVKAAEGSPLAIPSPTFAFGKDKAKGFVSPVGGALKSPSLAAVPPQTLEAANQKAKAAALSPLPDVGFESEGEQQPSAETKQKKRALATAAAEPPKPAVEEEKKAPASGGWDMAFLQKNAANASKATEAIEKKIEEEKSGVAAPAPTTATGTPTFSFGVPTPSTSTPAAAAAASTGGGAFGAASSQPAFSFGAPAASEPAATTPSVPSFLTNAAAAPVAVAEKKPKDKPAAGIITFGAPVAPEKKETTTAPPPTFGFGAPAAPAAAPVEEKKTEGAPSAAGWGEAFLKANASAATQTTAAAEEAIQNPDKPFGAPTSTSPAPTFGAPTTGVTSTFKFGAPASTEGIAAASAPALTFGAPPSTGATATASESLFKPAAPVEQPAATQFTFGQSAPAASSAATATFAFGAAAASSAAPATFTFGAQPASAPAPAAAPPATSASTGFAFGAQPAASQPAFGAPASSAAPAATGFTFGAGSSSGAAPSTFTFGAQPATTPAAAAAPQPQQPASQPGFGFGFGQASAPAPAQQPAGGMSFGAQSQATPSFASFGAQQQQPAAPTGGFGFGAQAPQQPQPQQPIFGGFGGQPQQQAPPAFGQPSPAPAFGGGGFGAPSQPQQPNAFGNFGAGAMPPPVAPGGFAPPPAFAAAQPFGAAQPPGQMIPNPFGGAPGGFSMGSSGGGGSQSEGRRKLKVKRAGRK